MLSPDSRYTDGRELATSELDGSTLRYLAPNGAPANLAPVSHVLGETDRLDLLAYQYLGKADLWWRICDANPAIPCPRELIGRGALVTSSFIVRTAPQADANRALVELRQRLFGSHAILNARFERIRRAVRADDTVTEANLIVRHYRARLHARTLAADFSDANVTITVADTGTAGIRLAIPEV